MNPHLPEICALIKAALTEDIGMRDVTSELLVPSDLAATGTIFAKEAGVVAGLPLLTAIFSGLDPDAFAKTFVRDGEAVKKGARLAQVSGSARALLAGERTALNFLQHLSGIATLTRRFVAAVGKSPCRILDTRKTTPGLRLLEKYAVRAGGGQNHRVGLFDQALVKDNHIELMRSHGPWATRHEKEKLKSAAFYRRIVELLRAKLPAGSAIEIEVETPMEALAAAQGGADILLLDNMPIAQIREAARLVRAQSRKTRTAGPLLEVSGGVTLARVRAIAATGVDRISVGALTHSAPALDIAMKITPIRNEK